MKQLITLISLFVSLNLFGQAKTNSTGSVENLVKQVNDYAQLVINKDTIKMVEKMYPKLVSMAGGREKVIEMTCYMYAKLASQGMSIDSVKFLKPNPIIETEDEFQTTLTQLLLMTVPAGKLFCKSTLIAISPDKGINWYFLDPSGHTLEGMRTDYPNLSEKLIIDPPVEPVLLRK
ncbi:MAG: hypothetical protein CFE21_03580 [Bacteroidetes bacterium B1(2017)]|nr:MAG: hypothetical protein CFE21_03580 [Bacteroidetes bacterium B1(2017)]